MARGTSGNSIRLNLVVSPRVKERMLRLQGWADADSMSEVVRRALAVYEIIMKAIANDSEIIIRGRDGSEEKLRVVP